MICIREKAELGNETKINGISKGLWSILVQPIDTTKKALPVIQNHVC